MNNVKGELSIVLPCHYATWKIPDFLDLPSECGYVLQSPRFIFDDAKWCLVMLPNGMEQTDRSIYLSLVRLTSFVVKQELLLRIGIHERSGKEEESFQTPHCFNDDELSRGSFLLKDRSEIEQISDELVPGGILTVYCHMRLIESNSGKMWNTDVGEYSSAICEYYLRKAEEREESASHFLRTGVFQRIPNIKGELSNEFPCHYATWKIPNFLDLPSEYDYFLQSPRFLFADAEWYLGMLPNGKKRADSDIFVSLSKCSPSIVKEKVLYVIGIIKSSGEEYERFRARHCFSDDVYTRSFKGHSFLQDRSEIEEMSDELVPSGTLTLYCHMRLVNSSSRKVSNIDVGENSSVTCEGSLRKPVEREESATGVKKLQTDYKKLLQSGEASDVCLLVSGKEFRAHRCILGARSPVFNAMFNHDTEERKSEKVVIDDLDPDSFPHFLEHVYTGRVEAFSHQNAFGLYTAADKYDVQALKLDCVKYMRRTLSVDSFFDVMTLALTHQEKELMELAVGFFKKNLGEIIRTVKWQKFMSENSTEANELLIKAIATGKNQQ